VSTTLGAEGIEAENGRHIVLADDPDDFAASVLALFDDASAGEALGRAGRLLVEQRYSWDYAGSCLEALYRRICETTAEPTEAIGGRAVAPS
jgi:glycosyltransferase involved in cell wall biosynthesis